MKNRFQFYLLLILFGSILFNSCEKIFEIPAEDVLEEDEVYTDNFSARSAVLGVYALLQDVGEQLVVLGELQGDLLTVTENADQDLIQVNEHNVDVNNRYADPTNFFKIIVNCNEVLHHIDTIQSRDKTITYLELNTYKAEMILIRAWTYFKLVQIYGEVPYFEEPLSDYDASLELADKLDSLQTEDFILDTLLTQITALDTFELNMDEDAPYYALRISKFMNWALQGEIYLWRNNYSSARRTYYKVVNIPGTMGWSGTYRLPYINDSRFNDVNWKNMYRFDYGAWDFEVEVIFLIPFSKYFNQQNNLQRMFTYGEGGDYLLRPTDYIINLFQEQKIIKWEIQTEHVAGTPGDLNRGKGISYDSIDGKPVVTKYSLFKEPFDNDGAIIIYSAGDFHLSTCEAVCRMGQSSNALDHLNQGLLYESSWAIGIRSRVNINMMSVEDIDDIGEVEDAILYERALELAFEGSRWFDLVRFARHKDSPSFLADKIAEKFSDPTKKEQVRERLMEESNWFLPLKLD